MQLFEDILDHAPLVLSVLTVIAGAVVSFMFWSHHLFKESEIAENAAAARNVQHYASSEYHRGTGQRLTRYVTR